MSVLLPRRRRIELCTKEIVVREFPAEAAIQVKEGDLVSPETIIAHYVASGGFRVFHLPEILGVSKKDVQKYLRKHVGEKIYQNEIVAAKGKVETKPSKFHFSLFKSKVFRSPVDGTIASLSDHGDMTIKVLPQRINQASLFWGKVVSVKSQNSTPQTPGGPITIAIETQTLHIYGIMGSGRRREGKIMVLSSPEDFLLPQKIEASTENAIVVCGSLIERGTLEKALSIKATGIIAGGIHLRDATAMGIRLPTSQSIGTDVGISIVATEGFGPATIGQYLYNQLTKYDNRYALIAGNDAYVAIPLRLEETQNIALPKDIEKTGTVEAKTGMAVRLLVDDYFGKIAIIADISKRTETLASGFSDIMLTVTLDVGQSKQTLTVPAANVEAIT